jgi:putative membrane protein
MTMPTTTIRRRSLLAALAAAPLAYAVTSATTAHAVDALPDSRFVGFAETINDFMIRSGQLALSKSQNELVRGFATRAIAEHTKLVSTLKRNRSEAGVSMAPHDATSQMTNNAMSQLNSLTGPQFDTAYANAVMRAETSAVEQYGAYSQSGGSGPLRRYAQESLPVLRELSEYSKRLAGGR